MRWPWGFNALERARVVDRGNIDFPFADSAAMERVLEEETFTLTGKGRRVLTFGGDHYVTLPLLKAHHRRHGSLALLQFDAHCDTDDAEANHHGVMFERAALAGLIDGKRSVQVGIRTWYDPPTHKLNVLDADWVTNAGPAKTAGRIREIIGDTPVYLTFDIDCLDPACAPGTGTPVIGGVTSNFALQTLRALRGMTIAGADLVEVSPPYDPSGVTALAGATIALEILHLMAEGVSPGRT
jgi:agmatinase